MDVKYSRINHVISARTDGRKSLIEIFKVLKSGIYNPKNFSALTYKVVNPKSTIIFFSTGNITVMGSSSYYGALYVLSFIKKKLNLKFINVRLTNIVTKLSIKGLFQQQLDIQKFFQKHSDRSISNMIIFPCCSYKIPNTKIKVNIFKTKKLVIAGCKNKDVVEESIQYILNEIQEFLDNYQHI